METENQQELTLDEQLRVDKAEALGVEHGSSPDDVVSGITNDVLPQEAAESEPVAEPVAEATPPEPAEDGYQIGDRYFATKQEALDYAKRLHEEQNAVDAYRQGLQDALQQQKGNQADAEPEQDDFDERFYTNPKEVIMQEVQRAKEDAKREALEQIQREQQVKQLWDEFYGSYPDLSNKKKLVNTILQENWDLIGHLPDHQEAMKILAKKTRDELKAWYDADKPKVELPNQKVGATPGGQSQVTRKHTEPEPLDFVSQIRQSQSRRKAST